MRNYPRNSPEAATRIVALIMLADGHVSHSEVASLGSLQSGPWQGLPPADRARVLRELSEDLMHCASEPWGRASHINEELLRALLADVDDPALRVQTLGLCREVAHADAHVSGAEESLLTLAADIWSLAPPKAT